MLETYGDSDGFRSFSSGKTYGAAAEVDDETQFEQGDSAHRHDLADLGPAPAPTTDPAEIWRCTDVIDMHLDERLVHMADGTSQPRPEPLASRLGPSRRFEPIL